MPDFLLELFSEEIPARMQRKAAGDLKKRVTDALVEAGLTYEGAKEYWTPRRLALDIRGVSARSADVREERKGPKLAAPQPAVHGFLKSVGIAPQAFADCEALTSGGSVRLDGMPEIAVEEIKGQPVFVARIEKAGRAAEDIIAEFMPGIIADFSWPKSMRWGPQSTEPGGLRWVRPLQSILATFGPETEEPVVVDFEVGGIRSGNVTGGHRFHAPGDITVRRFEDYAEKLEKAHVVLDAERRKEMIAADARNLAFANGVELVEDEGLLEEVAGLVEWPVVLMGTFDEEFLAIPDEVIRLTIKTNQKCFVCRASRPASPAPQHEGEAPLSNTFILVSNIEAKDGGADVARGNGKVVRARLSDALHFWRTDQAPLPDLEKYQASAETFGLDLSKPLDQRMAKLDHLGVTFHAKLGTQGERVARIAALAEELAPIVGAEPTKAKRAAHLAKADLTTEAVGEFPELQGVMGRKYAALQGEDAHVAAAIEDHYRPQGPSDAVPTDPVAIAVALADKLDTLTGFWAIDEKPTGSKDPYALRRAALGVIRIVVENGLRLQLAQTSRQALTSPLWGGRNGNAGAGGGNGAGNTPTPPLRDDPPHKGEGDVVSDLLTFFHDRLKVYLRDKGARHDLIDAILSEGDDDLLLIVRKVEALQALLETETGENLLAGTKRAMNILAAEEKKDGDGAFDGAVDPTLMAEPAEKELHNVLDAAKHHVDDHVARDDYEAAFASLAELRPAVDAFFDGVMVNADDADIRKNRLRLMASLRATTRKLADFGKIAG